MGILEIKITKEGMRVLHGLLNISMTQLLHGGLKKISRVINY